MNTEKSKLEFSGAGGNWQVIDEVDDPTVIQQKDSASCGPACAEMLLKALGINHISQELIASVSGTPVSVCNLAQAIQELDSDTSRQWIGGGFEIPGASDEELLEILMSTGVWLAELREQGARLGHIVVVDGYNTDGRLCIRDPWDKTQYKMDKYTFLQYWTFQGIYLKKL
ncbi:MAG: papain-like cysteine protease family protein [Calothrix sp. MO_192.B10]|nr:papain-like cysteine protease family protein [Calothrix sp. MO_192.B10]